MQPSIEVEASIIDQQVLQIKEKLNLMEHPEGGFFSECYRSPDTYGDKGRPYGSSIYFLMLSDKYSSWHKLDADEQWCHHEGSPVIIRTLNDRTGEMQTYRLGSVLDDASPQLTIEKGLWFCAEVEAEKSFTLVGCQVFPAFDFNGFKLADSAFWFKYKSHPKAEEIERLLHPDVKKTLEQATSREQSREEDVDSRYQFAMS